MLPTMGHENKPVCLLFTDDDENDYVLLSCAARRAQLPVPVVWVKDGMELLEYLRRQGRFSDAASYPWPALILLDLNMPRKNGRDALQEIRQDPGLRSLPVVILTTSRSAEDIQHSYEAGANSFITKPAEFQRLVEIMEVLKRYWFELVSLPEN
jgi:two-component system, response regulator